MRSLLISALLTTGCGATITAVEPHGDAAVDAPAVDAPAALTTCSRWAVSERAVVVSDPADQERFQLVDAIATPDGALVAWREHDANGRDDRVHVRRVTDDGVTHPWSAPGRSSRGGVTTLPRERDLQFSMVWDATRDGVAMLADGPTDRAECVFARFSGDDSHTRQTIDLAPLGDFTLAGCGSLARTDDGWSFLTAEVRALWGDQLVFLSEDGRVAGMPTRLPMTGGPSSEPMTRTDTTDGFVATWMEAERTPIGGYEFHARRFDRRGTPLGDDMVVSQSSNPYVSPRVLDTREGLLGTWFNGLVGVRPLRADASPAGDTISLNGVEVHANTRGQEVLAVTSYPLFDASMSEILFHVLDGRGERRVPPQWVRIDRPITTVRGMRVVPTHRGALIVFGQGERILAVPVGCMP